MNDMPLNKIAPITLSFWMIKICATTLGETAGDMLSMTLNVGYAASTLVLLAFFVGTLLVQLDSDRFKPLLYWSVILSTSTAGTTLSDFMDRTLGVGYARGSMILISILCVTLLMWRSVEGSLSVSRIGSRRAEIFYWAAILFSNTLGTALGDFLADDSGLGFLGGAIAIGGAIAVVALLYVTTDLSRVALFWIAFIFTRPFGATFGDFLTKGSEIGGLGLGTVVSSAILGAIMVGAIALAGRRCDAGGVEYA